MGNVKESLGSNSIFNPDFADYYDYEEPLPQGPTRPPVRKDSSDDRVVFPEEDYYFIMRMIYLRDPPECLQLHQLLLRSHHHLSKIFLFPQVPPGDLVNLQLFILHSRAPPSVLLSTSSSVCRSSQPRGQEN